MAKRGADRQLTQDNWEEEDDAEAEEAGLFREASKEELQKRQFRRAKRRLAPGEAASKVAPVFQGFAGFSAAKAAPAAVTTTSSSLSGTAAATGAVQLPAPVAPVQLPVPVAPVQLPLASSALPAAAGGSATAGSRDPQFSVELKSLNESVLDWISVHVKKNAYCILTPVFEDYESHLDRLRTKYPTTAVPAAPNGSAAAFADGVAGSGLDKASSVKPVAAAAAAAEGSGPPKSTVFTFQAAAPTSFTGFTKPPDPAVAALPATATTAVGAAPLTFSFSGSKPFTAFGSSTFGSSGSGGVTGAAAATAAAPAAATPEAKSENKEQADASASTSGRSSSSASLLSGSAAAAGLFKFGGLPSTQPSSTATSSLFQFGVKAATGSGGTLGATSSLFQFGTKPASNGSAGGGSTLDAPKPGTSFLFQNVGSKPAPSKDLDGGAAGGDDGEDNEEYVPPKPEVVSTVTEEGSVYTKRVKLFYKKDDSYVDKGIGNLFIKKVDAKTQLVLRADTNLGNILLNIVLNDKIPVVRQGTNNVSLVCIANPPMDPKLDATKPVALLLRVKSAADADELAEELNKHKKQA